MKLVGIISTAVLSLTLGAVAPVYAQQEQHEQQEEQKDKPRLEEKKAQPEKTARPEEKSAQQDKSNPHEEQNAQKAKSEQKEEHHEQPVERAGGNGRGRIPEEHFRANFGREHVFVINRVIVEGSPRFQYGGYWFGFGEPWPVGWYYTDNVYVDYVDGGYFLYNPVHPGIRIAINVF
jgi:hemolysin activation/secretion protein